MDNIYYWRKVYIDFKADTGRLLIVVFRYWKSLYLKDKEVDLKLTEYQSLLAKRVFPLNFFEIFRKRCIVLDKTTIHNWIKLCEEGKFSFSNEHSPILPEIWNVIWAQ